jgi:hypothetical protein
MEELVKQAFLCVDVVGPQVMEGRYDFMGPDETIYLPSAWQTLVHPGISITMHLWPLDSAKAKAFGMLPRWPGARLPGMGLGPPPPPGRLGPSPFVRIVPNSSSSVGRTPDNGILHIPTSRDKAKKSR